MTLQQPEIVKNSKGLVLRIKVKPRSKRSRVIAVKDGCIILEVQSPPVDEKANEAALRLIASFLGISFSCCELLSGKHCRDKRLLIRGISEDNFCDLWNTALNQQRNSCL